MSLTFDLESKEKDASNNIKNNTGEINNKIFRWNKQDSIGGTTMQGKEMFVSNKRLLHQN